MFIYYSLISSIKSAFKAAIISIYSILFISIGSSGEFLFSPSILQLFLYTHTEIYTYTYIIATFSTRFSKDSSFFFFFATLKISAISLQDLNFASLPWYLRCSFSPLDSRVFPLCLFFDPCFSAKPQFSLASVKPRTLLQLLLKPPFFFSFLFFPTLLSHLQPPLKYIHQIIISNQSLVDLIQKDYIQMDFFLVSLKEKDPFLINSVNFSKFCTILLYLNVWGWICRNLCS